MVLEFGIPYLVVTAYLSIATSHHSFTLVLLMSGNLHAVPRQPRQRCSSHARSHHVTWDSLLFGKDSHSQHVSALAAHRMRIGPPLVSVEDESRSPKRTRATHEVGAENAKPWTRRRDEANRTSIKMTTR
jgi:hypothetical protein